MELCEWLLQVLWVGESAEVGCVMWTPPFTICPERAETFRKALSKTVVKSIRDLKLGTFMNEKKRKKKGHQLFSQALIL